MANLQLAVKGEYFDAMIRGEKTEEYRLCNGYWNKRIMFREYDRLIITKGYPKRDDSSRRIDVPYEWNGEPFNRVIEAEDINDCYNHWMIWAQIAHAEVTNIRIEELKEHQAA